AVFVRGGDDLSASALGLRHHSINLGFALSEIADDGFSRAARRRPVAHALDVSAELAALEQHEINAVEIKRGVLLVLLFNGKAQAIAVERNRLLQILDWNRYARNRCRHPTLQNCDAETRLRGSEVNRFARCYKADQRPTTTSPPPSTRRLISPST